MKHFSKLALLCGSLLLASSFTGCCKKECPPKKECSSKSETKKAAKKSKAHKKKDASKKYN